MRAALLILGLIASAALAQPKPDETLSAVVGISAKIQPGARSAATLVHERRGSGALIRADYALTIGYLVIEAEAIEVSSGEGKTMPASLAAYDHASGFGLLRLAAPLGGAPLPLGDSDALAERQPAMVHRRERRAAGHRLADRPGCHRRGKAMGLVDPEDFDAHGRRVGGADGIGDVVVVAPQGKLFRANEYRDTIPSPIGTFSR